MFDDPHATEAEKSRAAQGLSRYQWNKAAIQQFQRATNADYRALRAQAVGRLWDALLIGLPKMAEHGDAGQAWFAYQMITRKKYGSIRPRPEVLAKVREMAPYEGARALWRISVVNDPKGPRKSTALLSIRRRARAALCRRIGIPITMALVKVPGSGFVKLLLETMVSIRPTLSPEQAVVLAAWGDSEQSMPFLKQAAEAGLFRPGWWPERPKRTARGTRRK